MILIFSDIHANKVAAQDLQRIAHRYETIICAGDIVGYGSDPEYVIDTLKELNVIAVRGNHDRMVIDQSADLSHLHSRVRDPILRTRLALHGSYLEYLESLPTSLEVGDIFVTHTLPDESYVFSPADAIPLLDLTTKNIIVIGHSHTQYLFHFGERQVVNPGSIAIGRRGHRRGFAIIRDGEIQFENLED